MPPSVALASDVSVCTVLLISFPTYVGTVRAPASDCTLLDVKLTNALRDIRSFRDLSGSERETIARAVIFRLESTNQIGSGNNLLDRAYSLAGAPHIFPDLVPCAATRTKTHFCRIGPRKIIGIEASCNDALAEIVAMHAG